MNILITGGTGSFGNAFIERLLCDSLADRIAILSRDEVKQAEMRERFPDKRLRFFIGDVRDKDRLLLAFRGVDTVIHAAALKRIEVGAYNPFEMVRTNVIGSQNVIEAAAFAGVERVVALSSDKAFQPCSPYGQSKALAEALFMNANNMNLGPKFSVTRYGNVAGSRGSIIPIWRRPGPHRATDLDCTRFFMFMHEAVDLVLDTIDRMPLLNVPNLPAYRLGDLAEAMGVTPEITGLPAYEKKHESMADGNSSDKARRMSVDELREALERV